MYGGGVVSTKIRSWTVKENMRILLGRANTAYCEL